MLDPRCSDPGLDAGCLCHPQRCWGQQWFVPQGSARVRKIWRFCVLQYLFIFLWRKAGLCHCGNNWNDLVLQVPWSQFSLCTKILECDTYSGFLMIWAGDCPVLHASGIVCLSISFPFKLEGVWAPSRFAWNSVYCLFPPPPTPLPPPKWAYSSC